MSRNFNEEYKSVMEVIKREYGKNSKEADDYKKQGCERSKHKKKAGI